MVIEKKIMLMFNKKGEVFVNRDDVVRVIELLAKESAKIVGPQKMRADTVIAIITDELKLALRDITV